MPDPQTNRNPPLADLVRSGEGRHDADKVTDFLFTAVDQTNAHLVTTSDGDVMINTGILSSVERNRAVLAPHRTGAMRRIIVTQSHPDHFGGVNAFREAGTQVVVQGAFARDYEDIFERLRPALGPRTAKLWGATLQMSPKTDQPRMKVSDFTREILVDREYAFEQGGRRFEVISTPGGETLDNMVVWMPNERIVFTGNLFGPVFMGMPFLNTLRGDKPRLVNNFLPSLDRVRNLGAEILVTGHEVFRGAARIRANLDKLYDAVSWIRDYTLDGMNAGKDVFTLMREVRLPEHLLLSEPHGKISWGVRAIYHEYSGWFLFDYTTSLYGVPRSSIDADLADMAGGPSALAARARRKMDQGKALEAMHMVEIARGADPDCVPALEVQRDALGQLLDESGRINLSETMWLLSELRDVESRLATASSYSDSN